MKTIVKNRNRDFFSDVFAPILSNGFESVFSEDLERRMNDFVPAANILENDKEVVISLSLAGFNKDQVNIDVKDNLLTVKGENKVERKEEGETYHRMEISNGSFTRSFRLDNKKDLSKIDARFQDGLLYITIPKKEEDKAIKVSIK